MNINSSLFACQILQIKSKLHHTIETHKSRVPLLATKATKYSNYNVFKKKKKLTPI